MPDMKYRGLERAIRFGCKQQVVDDWRETYCKRVQGRGRYWKKGTTEDTALPLLRKEGSIIASLTLQSTSCHIISPRDFSSHREKLSVTFLCINFLPPCLIVRKREISICQNETVSRGEFVQKQRYISYLMKFSCKHPFHSGLVPLILEFLQFLEWNCFSNCFQFIPPRLFSTVFNFRCTCERFKFNIRVMPVVN